MHLQEASMSIQHISTIGSARRPSLLTRALQFLALASATRRYRQALGRLDPHLLRDIGLTCEQAQAEATRPLWDVPSHWRG
jgi:uncharacterized protein YjiS (DUF1127 family)